MKGIRTLALAGALGAALAGALCSADATSAAAAGTSRASVGTNGEQAQYGNSYAPMVSATGRFIAFESTALYLADGINSAQHIYLRDREAPLTERISVSSAETLGNYGSLHGTVSADGRFVAFQSQATNLVTPATVFARFHIYLRDRQEGTTILVSAPPGGGEGNQHSSWPAITPDGRYIAFASAASNLTAPPGNGYQQILRYDRSTGEIITVSLGDDGQQAGAACYHPSISDDGNLVAFHVAADLDAQVPAGGFNVFVRDIAAAETRLVSVNAAGDHGGNTHSTNPAISGDGSHVAFESLATDLVGVPGNGHPQIYLRDLAAGANYRASAAPDGTQGNSYSMNPAINGDGSAVAFESNASNLVEDINGRVDIFVYRHGAPPVIERVSVRDESVLGPGEPPDANAQSWLAAIDAGGLITAFESWSTDLVADDTNGVADIFVRESDPVAVDPALIPAPLGLSAWPNPLRGGAGVRLSVALPEDTAIRAAVYDVAGRSVRVLASGSRPAGQGILHWDGRDERGQAAPAGVYVLRLGAGERSAAHKLVLLP